MGQDNRRKGILKGKEMERLIIIVDVSNVAYNQNPLPKLKYILLIKKKLSNQKKDALFITTPSLKYKINKKEVFSQMISSGIIVESPAERPDDLYILEIAKRLNGFVLSNDCFHQYKEIYSEVLERRITYMIIRDEVIIPAFQSNDNIYIYNKENYLDICEK